MNLVQDSWMPFRLRDGSEVKLPLAAIVRDDIVDFALPRVDFQGSAYQLVIGLLQTVYAPEDKYEWCDRYEIPPAQADLQAAFNEVVPAFNLMGDGPLFMQDFDALESAKCTSVSGLLIESPGENTLKNNTDHFVKRGIGSMMSLPMAALALFTLQTNAPSGGQGHRVGLRGGGPLTTLIFPSESNPSLWHRIWLNIINREFWVYEDPDLTKATVFPWLGPTKTSDQEGSKVYANDVHPLHMFWAMPRRIRLNFSEQLAQCQLTGESVDHIVSSYRAQNYGINYSGTWRHPLTAYRWDPKKPDEAHNSVKAQPGGLTYKYWNTLTLTEKNQGQNCALTVEHFYQISEDDEDIFGEAPRLWAFGYDMDNMKARGWYESLLPLFAIELNQQSEFLRAVKELQDVADKARLNLNKNIKEAWFERPQEAKGDTSFIAAQFWQRTEGIFFQAIQQLAQQPDYYPLNTASAQDWLRGLQQVVVNLFDEYTLSADIGDPRSMKRCMRARRFLTAWLYGSKEIKNFKLLHKFSINKEIA